MKVCPKCHKEVKDLNGHLARIHKLNPDLTPMTDAQSQDQTPEILTVKKPARQPQKVLYHCVDCGTEFEGKPENCPGCGAILNWEGLEHA